MAPKLEEQPEPPSILGLLAFLITLMLALFGII